MLQIKGNINLKWKEKLVPTINKENIKNLEFSHFFQFYNHNPNEIKGLPKFEWKQKVVDETEILKIISWQDIVITVYFWENFPLCSMRNSKPVAVYEVSFVNLLQFFSVKLTNLSFMTFDTFFRIFFLHKSVMLI